MAEAKKNNINQAWKPDDFIKSFEYLIEDYERDHPHWQIEVLMSLVRRGMQGLQNHLNENKNTIEVWDSPFVDLDYPVTWNWDAPRVSESDIAYSGLTYGTVTEENTRNSELAAKTLGEMLVRRLNTQALANFTNDAWFEIKNDYQTPILPIALNLELAAVKDEKARRALFNEFVHPFSIGAATIDFSSMKMENGEKVSKEVVEQLQKINRLVDIDRIAVQGNIDGHEFASSLVFQINPLVVDYDRKKAYFKITVGLFFAPKQIYGELVTDTPAKWSELDRNLFWSELDRELEKLTDQLIPKAESCASKIFQINACLEIPLSDHDDKNAALKTILDTLSHAGQVHKISVEPVYSTPQNEKEHVGVDKAADPEKVPKSPTEGLTLMIWKSRFRSPLILILSVLVGIIAVFAVLPESIKLKILNFLGIH